MSEQWGFSQHGAVSRNNRATIVSGFETREAAIEHAKRKHLVRAVIDVGRVTRGEDGKTKFEVVETMIIPGRGDEGEPPSLGELAADAEMETGCAPEDAVQVGIEHLIDRARREDES